MPDQMHVALAAVVLTVCGTPGLALATILWLQQRYGPLVAATWVVAMLVGFLLLLCSLIIGKGADQLVRMLGV